MTTLDRRRSCALSASLILLAAAASASAAQPRELDVVSFWRAATETDVAAAYALIEENHPGVLAEVGDALKDKHIWSRPTFVVARPEWAGILLSKRGARWIVVDEEQNAGTESTKGAELTNCDGRSPEDWAHQTLGTFRVNWPSN
jgi:hypothetical protein